MQAFTASKPCTIVYKSKGGMFRLFDLKKRVHYYRKLKEPGEYSFNIPIEGNYLYEGAEFIKEKDLEKKEFPTWFSFPASDREDLLLVVPESKLYRGLRFGDFASPARTFVRTGEIQTNKRFETLPPPFQKFILCHETGHLTYHNESLCDLFALKRMLDLGYNQSTCIHAMTRVLNDRYKANQKREIFLVNVLKTINQK